MAIRSINVWLRGNLAGVLSEREGRLCFQYDSSWLNAVDRQPLSLSLPLVQAEISDCRVSAYFQGLLPEAKILELVAARLDIHRDDCFSLLEHLGKECTGAVQIMHEQPSLEGQILWLDPERLERLGSEVMARPLFAGVEYVSQCLPGEDAVLAVIYDGERIGVPLADTPSTHILEFAVSAQKNPFINRMFCADLARAIGLPSVKPVQFDTANSPFLLVPRNDRIFDGKGSIERFHCEDLTQAMGIFPQQKYQRHGGPDLVECLALARRCGDGDHSQVQQLLRQIMFNNIIGNHAAHAKQYVLSYRYPTAYLAEPLAMQSTAIDPESYQGLAMKVNGEDRFEKIKIHHWIRATDNCGLSGQATRALLEQLVADIRRQLPKVIQSSPRYKDAAEIEAIVRLIARRSEPSPKIIPVNSDF